MGVAPVEQLPGILTGFPRQQRKIPTVTGLHARRPPRHGSSGDQHTALLGGPARRGHEGEDPIDAIDLLSRTQTQLQRLAVNSRERQRRSGHRRTLALRNRWLAIMDRTDRWKRS